MDPSLASALLAILVVGTVAVGALSRHRSGRKRRARVGDLAAADFGLPSLGATATVVQLSTEYCATCPGVHRALAAEFDGDDGVLFTDVDLTHRPELAARLRVMQTPTVLVVDGAGHVAARFAGAVTPTPVRAETDTLRKGHDAHLTP